MKVAVGLVLGVGIGAICRFIALPLPAPPVLTGALLVVAMTLGYLTANWFAAHRTNDTLPMCGGPTGTPDRPDT